MGMLTYQILKLKEFILTAGVMGLFLMLAFLVMAVRPKRGMAHYGFQAFFLNRSRKETLYLSASFLQLAFAVSCLVCRTELATAHLAAAGALCLIKAAALPSAVSILSDILYSVFLVLALLASGLLDGFLRQTSGDPWLLAVYWLLQIFILEYAVYECAHSLQVLLGRSRLFEGMKIRRERRRKKRRIRKELEETYG